MFRIAFLFLSVTLIPIAALAEPFSSASLFVGRSIKPHSDAKTFVVGLRTGAAPLDLAIGSARERLIAEGVKDACGNDQICQTQTKQGLDSLSNLTNEQWSRIEKAASNDATLKQELQALGLSPEESERIVNYVSKNASSPEERKQVLAIAREVAETRANVLLAPFCELNLNPVFIGLEMPLVMTLYEDKTDFSLGNFNTDVRLGHYFNFGPVTFGLSYGLALYFPTGGKGSEPAAYSFLPHAPMYLKSYLSVAPYLVVGLDIPFVNVQAHGELVSMHKVRTGIGHSSVQFMKYGLGLTILPDFLVSFIGELNGLAPMNNADDFNALFGLGGLRVNLWILRAGVAVQAPVYSKVSAKNLPPIRGIPINTLAKLGVMAHVAFEF